MKTISAIICITVLVGFALYLGFDGAILNTALVAIAGLGGFALGRSSQAR